MELYPDLSTIPRFNLTDLSVQEPIAGWSNIEAGNPKIKDTVLSFLGCAMADES